MKFANRNIKTLKPYKLASHKIWEVANQNDVLKLDWNESTVPPSPKVIKAITELVVSKGLQFYPDVNNKELVTAISRYCNVLEGNVQYFSSSDSAHEYISRCFLAENDVVTMLSPTYDNFRLVCESLGAKVNHYNRRDEFNIIDLKNVIESNGSKLVYICNPNNPTGELISEGEIESLICSLPEVMFLVDEAYFEFSSISCSNLVLNNKNLIITRTFSKAFALANLRIGYIISSEKNIEVLNRIRNAKNISSVAQVAAIAALSDIDYMQSYVNEVKKAKLKFEMFLSAAFLNDAKVFKGHGNFILVRFKEDEMARNLVNHLENNNIFIRNLSHVNTLESCLRFTIGTTLQMEKVEKCIVEFKK